MLTIKQFEIVPEHALVADLPTVGAEDEAVVAVREDDHDRHVALPVLVQLGELAQRAHRVLIAQVPVRCNLNLRLEGHDFPNVKANTNKP